MSATMSFRKFLSRLSLLLFFTPLNVYAEMNEASFNRSIQQIYNFYAPLASLHQIKIDLISSWQNETINASAILLGNTFRVSFFGGLARKFSEHPDAFTLVVCHEFGHFFGGVPFLQAKVSAEGQADYFAAQSCLRNIWHSDTKVNALSAQLAPEEIIESCNSFWFSEADRNLCYRIQFAGYNMMVFFASFGGRNISFEPDQFIVNNTNKFYPSNQCRFDTIVAGSLCRTEFEAEVIPQNIEQAKRTSCMTANGYGFDERPRCWFKP